MNAEQTIDIALTEYNFDRMSFDEAKEMILKKILEIRIMENINKEITNAGLVSCLLDIVDDIIRNGQYEKETKFRANNAKKAIETFQFYLYGNQSREPLDDIKEKIAEYAFKVAQGEFQVKNEDPKENSKVKIKEIIKNALPVSNVVKESCFEGIMEALEEGGFKIIEL